MMTRQGLVFTKQAETGAVIIHKENEVTFAIRYCTGTVRMARRYKDCERSW